MNPAAEQPPPPPAAAQPQLLQPHRSSFSCDRHPDENFTGFCPSCLCERLTTLDQSSNAAASSSSRRPSTSSTSATAALKSLFKLPPNPPTTGNKIKTSFFPELRRTKSFSASKNEGLSGVFEPQRKSCDVRGARNTLWTLFSIDDENKSSTNLAENGPVLEDKDEGGDDDDDDDEELEEVEEEEDHEEPVNNNNISSDHDDEIRVCEEEPNVTNFEETTVLEASPDDVKTMKDHIDLDSQAKKPALSNFWSAASVFSKKWHKWRRKQKLKKRGNDGDFNDVVSMALPVEKPISRQYRETQSEIADYGFGRRSCDTDPRFSLDAGRISFDDPRYSFDEPRASWDGYLIGRTFPRLPPMVEDAPVVHVARSDTLIPVEQPDESVPGGSTQTREYYSDSSSKRRKSLDRSNSIRKTAAAVVAEIDEMKGGVSVSNAKVSPATIDYIHAAKLLGGERGELIRDSNSNSLRDDCSETFELGFRDNGSVIGGGEGERKGSKKLRRWSWKLWGFIHRRGGGGNKDEEEERYSRVNGVERSFSESWQDLRREGNGEGKNGLNRRVFRSNSSVSWRNSYNVGGSFGSVRKSNSEINGNGNGFANGNGFGIGIGSVKKKRDEFVLERNRSARYSPNNHVDNGLLRFYLTPLRGSRRGGVGSGKSRANNSHSIARSVLRLY